MNSAILERIKKLLALANSKNEHEAKAAADKAQELLVRHNLDAQAVGELFRREYDKSVPRMRSRLTIEDRYVVSIIVDYFFVQAIYIRSYATGRRQYGVSLVGEKTNLAIACYVYDFLLRAFRDCFATYRRRTGDLNLHRIRTSYYYGLSAGVVSQLAATRLRVQTDRALTLVDDPALKKFVEEQTNGSQTVGHRGELDKRAATAGYEDGKNLRIQRGLSGTAEQAGKLLGKGGP